MDQISCFSRQANVETSNLQTYLKPVMEFALKVPAQTPKILR